MKSTTVSISKASRILLASIGVAVATAAQESAKNNLPMLMPRQ